MPQMGEPIAAPALGGDQKKDQKKEERTCPKCGAKWTKTEPTLAQVKSAISEEITKYADELHAIEPRSQFGYRGSVARGTVGDDSMPLNKRKPHHGMEPDIRGECGVKYDIDGFMLSQKVFNEIKPDKWKKRWASAHPKLRVLETKMRASLTSRSELQYMKAGADGFEILVRSMDKKAELLGKGGVVLLIF